MFQSGLHAVEEAHQRARPLGELEAVQQLVAAPARARPPTMWRTCSLASSSSVRSSACGSRARAKRAASALASRRGRRSRTPTNTCASRRVGDAVVELGDVARPEQRAEAPEAAALLGNRHREHRLALLADLGALGDEAQAVEVHVRAAGDRRRASRRRRRRARRRTAFSAGDAPARRPARGCCACPRTRP